MKKTFFFSVMIISLLFLTMCQKEDVDTEQPIISVENVESLPSSTNSEVTPRSGFVDLIFYRTSLTTDNYLISQKPGFVKTYQAFNKSKIDSIVFVSTGNGLIFADRVIQKHYQISIYFKQNPLPQIFTAFSKNESDKFTYIPTNSVQLLTSSNTARTMSFEIQKSASVKYNYWDGTSKVYNFVKISKDGVKVDTRVLDPLSKDTNIFMLPNTH